MHNSRITSYSEICCERGLYVMKKAIVRAVVIAEALIYKDALGNEEIESIEDIRDIQEFEEIQQIN